MVAVADTAADSGGEADGIKVRVARLTVVVSTDKIVSAAGAEGIDGPMLAVGETGGASDVTNPATVVERTGGTTVFVGTTFVVRIVVVCGELTRTLERPLQPPSLIAFMAYQ
jgi:hypothetical protein